MMMLNQSEALAARRVLPILMVDVTDGYTEEPGLALTVAIRKSAGAFAVGGGTIVERGSGRYEYTATQAELDTLGVFEYRAVGAGARNFQGVAQVVAIDPYTDVGAAVLGAVITLPVVLGSLAEAVLVIRGLVNGNVRQDQQAYDGAGLLTSARIRVFPTAADATAQTNVLATFLVSAVNSLTGPTSYVSVQVP